MGTFPNNTFSKISKEELFAIQSKGGSVRSLKKKLAAQIRYAKQSGFKQRQSDRLIEMLSDADVFDFQIGKYIQEALDDPRLKLTSRVRADLIGRLSELRKISHGSKDKAVNINIMNQFEDKMSEFKERLAIQEDMVIDITPDTRETAINVPKQGENL